MITLRIFSLFIPNMLNKIRGKQSIITNDSCMYNDSPNKRLILNTR